MAATSVLLSPQPPHLILEVKPQQSTENLPQEVETFPTIGKEENFSAVEYLARAHVIGTLGLMCFRFYFLGAVVLIAIASWYLFSAVIVIAHHAAEGTRLERPINHLHALAIEVNAAVACAFLFPSTLFKSYHDSKGDPKGQPMLCINGYLSFGATWHYLTERLVKAGFGPIRTMNVISGTSIVTNALAIREEVRQFKAATGRSDLILLCHSKGGLGALYYAIHYAEADGITITDMAFLGSPLAGTPIAYLGVGYDAYEMRPESEFILGLQEKIIALAQKIRLFHIVSEPDIVVPMTSALYAADPARQMIIKDIGHLGLIFSSRVANQICVWLYLRILKNNPSLTALSSSSKNDALSEENRPHSI